VRLYVENKLKSKNVWRCGSVGRVLAYQVQTPVPPKKKKRKKKKKEMERVGNVAQ
jgi:hypothetical protein